MHARNARSGEEGWTLLEMMAVVLILGLLVSIAVATYRVSVVRSERVACQSNQHILSTAVIAYQEDHNGSLPPDLDALGNYVKGKDYKTCPGVRGEFEYEATSGRITCPHHPPQ